MRRPLMHKAKAFAFVALGILVLAGTFGPMSVPAQAQPFTGPVTPTTLDNQSVFLESNGNVWQLRWTPEGTPIPNLCGNLFSAGVPASQAILGMGTDGYTGKFYLFTDTGGLFVLRWLSEFSFSITADGNFFDPSTPPSGLVAGWTDSHIGKPIMMTANGDMWMLVWDSPTGPHHPISFGNFFGEQPVRTTPTTWGRIKAERR
jgi:hypothetical protein